ncbi:GDSL-type esterase/lipase family protein [uncultured Trichococcus sp.]|uniref:GDSL-type esterase/lipase family protein n=1 Tax=uncultured Trichococcus sp. TaxID=189665 RepID=UPI002A1898FA|nr:GDSL-type esterase/lipase family protein [uncultured Trichococcus sp.]
MIMRKIATMLLSLSMLSTVAIGKVSAAENNKSIDYVALGDSLAAGQKPTAIGSASTKLYGTSYPKFIRDDLSSNGLLNSYANFGMSGYETWNVANDLMTTDSATQNAISEAEIITLDIGANDLLAYLEAEEGDVSNLLDRLAYMDQDQINYLIYQMDLLKSSAVPYTVYQVSTIVAQIKTLNPDAQIYVMGYYNAFSFLNDFSDDPALQSKIDILIPELEELIQAYNIVLEQAITAMSYQSPGITYVSTWEAMGGDVNSNARTYLPLDIHPTVQGYRAIAQAFWDEMSE